MLASIPSPASNGLHVGPFFVHAYGLAYALAVVAAIAITTRRWEALGGRRELVQEVALWGFPAGLIGGRVYFLATSWDEVPQHWWGPLAIWRGGLGIWGGIALGTLAGLLVLRRRGADIPRFLDAAAPGLHIDPGHRPAGYLNFATFHPTFLYELVWNLALAAALVWVAGARSDPPGS